jgi:type I restriction enzyme S subunit
MALINLINLSEIENFKDLSADFYKVDFMNKSKTIRSLSYRRLSQISYITDGEHGSPCWSEDSGIKYITAEYIKENFIENGNFKQITIDQDIRNARARLRENDILIYSVGAYAGLTCVAEPHLFPANIPRSVAIVRLNNTDEFLPEFISVFLNSNVGKFQSIRFRAGNSQPVLALEKFRQFEIPLIEYNFQKEIKNLYQKSYNLRSQSQTLYKQANDLLEQEFHLNRITFEKKKSYVASFSEVATTRRMNAEYFSPLVKKILSQSFLTNSKPIGALFQIIRGNSPKQYFENGLPVIKTKNIRVPEIDRERVSDYVLSTKDLTTIQENDLLLASMGVGSLGRMSYILSLDEDTVVDGTIRVFRRKFTTPKNYEIPTLLFLSTKVGQELIYRGIVGSTGIISLPDDYLSKIPIPHFSEDLCLELTRLVKESMMAKRESKRLLEEAKTRVEQLIEEAANK